MKEGAFEGLVRDVVSLGVNTDPFESQVLKVQSD